MLKDAKGIKKAVRRRTFRSLNFTLWIVLSLLSVVLIAALTAIYHTLASSKLYETACQNLVGAGERILRELPEEGEDIIPSVAYEEGVGGAYLYSVEDGSALTYAGEEHPRATFEEYAAALTGKEKPVFSPDGTELVYGTDLTLDGRAYLLFLTLSLAPIEGFRGGFAPVSLIASLTAVVVAFALSAIVSMLVSRPIGEVTEQAKELARGNYSPDRGKKYYFSEISELSEALDDARREISKADMTQRELVANISHDFKTPLTMIKAYASMIREISGENKEKRDAHAQIIIDEADRLSALVSDVLDLSRLRAGEEEEKTAFDLSAEVHAIVSRFDYLEKTQGYRFEVLIEDGLMICAERMRIGQVVYNLIGNAVNYTGEDKRVRVKLGRRGEMARLEVIDSGNGIPPEEVDTIWDRYYRSGRSHKRPVQGSGLGLSIVKSILLQHDAPFGVISEVGKGSCFWAEFRLMQPDAGAKEGKV